MYETVCRGLQNRGRRAGGTTRRKPKVSAIGKSGPYGPHYPVRTPTPENCQLAVPERAQRR